MENIVVNIETDLTKQDLELEERKTKLRCLREQKCFPIVNRGTLWYMRLSNSQHQELVNWYNKWLDVTKTMVVPDDLDWINEKLNEEEVIL